MTRCGEIAIAFASALVGGDFERAHRLLTPELRDRLSPAMLREQLYDMFRSYAHGEPISIHYDEQFSMTEWPAKEPHDVGWAYVSISGEEFVEAVTLVVAEVDGTLLVRDIEWGRP